MFARMSGIVRLAFMSMLLARSLAGQSDSTLAKLRWSAPETSTGRFLIVPGQRSMVAGYRTPGLEVWAYPLQIVRDYWPSFRVEGTSADIDGRTLTGILEHTPTTATRIYDGPGFAVHERVFTPTDLPAATITYSVRSSRPVTITLHFTPSLNLMWPAGIGGQEIHWDSAHFAYILDEPSHRFRAAIMSRQIVAHDPITNDTHGADFERSMNSLCAQVGLVARTNCASPSPDQLQLTKIRSRSPPRLRLMRRQSSNAPGRDTAECT